MNTYKEFLNVSCKIRFQFYVEKESKKLTWRDLTGPEKNRLFKNMNVSTLFPMLQKRADIQRLWKNFFELMTTIRNANCDINEFESKVKSWVELITSVYQSKDVKPYMHAFAMHVPEFLKLYGNITMFTQQGLEKLNDITTIHFQRSSNHREMEALVQVLEKRNRLEALEDDGFMRTKQVQVCSSCKCKGHNKRSCGT